MRTSSVSKHASVHRRPHSSPFALRLSLSAFTLVELLTVIAIIAVLAGLLVPTIKTAMLKAETAKAQTAISGLSTAFRAYYTEYGKWPIVDSSGSYNDFIVDEVMVALLSGDDVGGVSVAFPTPPGPAIDTLPVGTYSSLGTAVATIQRNARKIPFLEFKTKDIDKTTGNPDSGSFLDPWGRPYHFRLDVNYQNNLEDPFFSAVVVGSTVTNGFLIWSVGPDGQYDRTTTGISQLNKDNVKSW